MISLLSGIHAGWSALTAAIELVLLAAGTSDS
jgi:hypothetical protein